MYPPSTLAASSICAAFSGLATPEQKNIWTKTRLESFLQRLTNIEPVRKILRADDKLCELMLTKLRQCFNLRQTKANTLLTVANKGNNSSALPRSEIQGL